MVRKQYRAANFSVLKKRYEGMASSGSLTQEKMEICGPIIIVDDDHDDHEIFGEVCETLHVSEHLLFFDNGLDLIKYLKSTEKLPFVILCDINMPMLDGMALRKVIEADEVLRRKSIPFIFFSTSATDQQVKEAYTLTVQGFFVKGRTFQETRRKFRRILEYWSDCRHPNSRN
jgi:CheY-like chemotaxis protein